MEVEKVEALVYIYTNSCLLCQRPSTNPICYYNGNIFLEESDSDGGTLLETNDDDNNDNDSKGPNGGDGDAFDERKENHKKYLLLNPRNVCQECSFNWNEIDEEVANNIDGHVAVGSIGNMHVNEEATVGFIEHGYDLANEELDDDDYNDATNDHGEENENKCGRNGDSNDHGEGGATSTMVSGSNDATPIGNRDGGTSNASKEEPTEEDPNHGIEIQDNPLPFDTNVNSQVPNIVILAMGNADEDDDVLLNEMFPNVE